MTAIISANGLIGDKSYSVQVRPIFNDGSTGDWGPTFAIIKRDVSGGGLMSPITASPAGVRVAWTGTLVTEEFEEQWLVKKFDTSVTESNFDIFGTEVYRGVGTTVDLDLNQEPYVEFAVVKTDKYGNRSSISTASKTFGSPTSVTNAAINNSAGGFAVTFNRATPSDTNKFHLVRVKFGTPFTAYDVTAKSKTGNVCSVDVAGSFIIGDTVQISINDNRFDGIYRITNVSGSSISYVHDTTGSVTYAASGGQVIPTSSGPSVEGAEVYRTEIVSSAPTVTTFDYVPQTSGQKMYIAIGTEDAYKNRISWTIAGNDSSILSYGRNFIGERDGITLSTTNNRTVDGYWKYGYIGWKGAHNTSTLALNAPGTAGGLIIAPVTADNPDTIKLGVTNGSSTTMQFASDPSGTPSNSQSRLYPSVINPSAGVISDGLALPIVDDAYYAPSADADKSVSYEWETMHPSEVNTEDPSLGEIGKGLIWVECSASDVLDDSVKTKNPIILNGAMNLTGSFTAKLDSWTADLTAKLYLYAVGGDWNGELATGIYDPHFHPRKFNNLGGAGRSVYKINSVTNVSKSSYTVTLTLATGASSYPVAGDSITVSINNQYCDGTWIVTSVSSNVVTYITTNNTAVGSTSATGQVFTNGADKYSVTNKVKTSAADTRITISGSNYPSAGGYIDVSVGDVLMDGSNMLVTDVTGSVVTYTHTSPTSVSSAATPGTAAAVVRREDNIAPCIEISSWDLSHRDAELFDDPNYLEKTCSWNFNSSASLNINTLRFVWIVEFDQGQAASWSTSESHTVKIGNFQAWPGVNTYAATGTTNEYSDPQIFNAGASVLGSLSVDGDVSISGNVTVDGDSFTAGDMFANSVTVTEDINVINGNIYVDGNDVINAASMSFLSDDYPTMATSFAGSTTDQTINAIRSTDDIDVGSASHILCIVVWSGRFEGGAAGDTYMFKLWSFDQTSDPSTAWTTRRRVKVRGSAAGTGASITHMMRLDKANNPRPAFAITAANDATGTALTSSFGGGGNDPNNRLQVLMLPVNTGNASTTKPAGVLGGSYNLSGYTQTDGASTSEPKSTKSATYVFNGGWSESYKEDGSINPYAGGYLMQGFKDLRSGGNQKSLWGFGTDAWSILTGGDATGASPVEPKILSCTLGLYVLKSGTAVIGTHRDPAAVLTTPPTTFGATPGRVPDRLRAAFGVIHQPAFNVDLGTQIGKEIWNHARLYIPNAGTYPGAEFVGEPKSGGIIYGPGPSTAPVFYTGFDPTIMKIIIKVQWKE